MTRIQELTSQPAIATEGRAAGVPRSAILVAAGLLVIGIMFGAYVAFAPADLAPAGPAAGAAGDVTDGWLPGVQDANERALFDRAARTSDGWSSALLKPALPAVDGWAARYLVSDGD
jgi:hypothetical protein